MKKQKQRREEPIKPLGISMLFLIVGTMMQLIMLMECARTAIIPKAELRSLLTVNIQKEHYMQRGFAKTVIFQYIISKNVEKEKL